MVFSDQSKRYLFTGTNLGLYLPTLPNEKVQQTRNNKK